MLEEGRACEDVLTQLLAARSGLESAGALVFEHHLQDCVLSGLDVTPDVMDRLTDSIRRWSRPAHTAR